MIEQKTLQDLKAIADAAVGGVVIAAIFTGAIFAIGLVVMGVSFATLLFRVLA